MRKTVRAVVAALAVLLLPNLVGLGLVALTRRQPLQTGRTWYQARLLPPKQWGFFYSQLHCGESVLHIGCVVVLAQPNKDGICI